MEVSRVGKTLKYSMIPKVNKRVAVEAYKKTLKKVPVESHVGNVTNIYC